MTGDHFLDEILWRQNLRQGHNFILLCCSSKAPWMPSALHLSSNGQCSRVSGYPRRHQNQCTARHAHPPPPGPPPTCWPAPAPAPSPPALAQSKREVTHHPKLWALMDPYLLQYNNVLNLLDNIVRKANDRSPNPSTILPSYRSPVHLLEQCIGKMLQGPPMQVCQRPCAER
jgi:hypothetical protein